MGNNTLSLILPFSLLVVLIFLYWRIRWKRLKSYQSSVLGLIEVWGKYNGEKVLTINKYSHGISIDDKTIRRSYWYFIAQEVIHHIKQKNDAQVLFLGLGANASSGIIHRGNPHVKQTIIEIDENIIQACRDFFQLDEMKNINIVKGDAYKLIDKRSDFYKKFDAIVVDIFTGIPPYVSTQTNRPPFINKLLKWLKKEGRIIFNRPANIKADREDTKKLFSYLKTLFKEVKSTYIDDPRGYKNDILTATGIKNKNN
ncbi:hypothetical protein A2773_01790 [Candidatus Gottesmanbacteria bacterium RIFCSPHIGHO2_01_FULL_39_10]|uniref:PABS domain-containing protein n=1 Tax=Candidatus Gottesmanbacteria bacterium RIFCSPHIGHO2_01_FULL_39_10 TaxID=1798375 RepID=A0A1F5ZKA0_9BACT|nr:MAG: hypothetical protein A2773_01790 [Candidatus Gottesmanbacteria bacterium RIFCSPHIGHO2_01_FULL_39_10]